MALLEPASFTGSYGSLEIVRVHIQSESQNMPIQGGPLKLKFDTFFGIAPTPLVRIK